MKKMEFLYMLIGVLVTVAIVFAWVLFSGYGKVDPVPYKPDVKNTDGKSSKSKSSKSEEVLDSKEKEVDGSTSNEVSSEVDDTSKEEKVDSLFEVKDVPLENLSPEEAKVRSLLYEGELSNDNSLRVYMNEAFRGSLRLIREHSLAEFDSMSSMEELKLGGTDKPMVTTVYLFFVFQGYSLDESYTRVYSSNIQPNLFQVIFKATQEDRGDVYFLAYYNTETGNFTVKHREGGSINGTFG